MEPCDSQIDSGHRTTLVAAHLEDLNIDENVGDKQRRYTAHTIQTKQASKQQGQKTPVMHGRKAATYLRVFDDSDADVGIQEQKLRSRSSTGVVSPQDWNVGSTSLGQNQPQREPRFEAEDNLQLEPKSQSEPQAYDNEDLTLVPKTSASALYLTGEDRNVLSSHNDISIVDEKDQTSVGMFGSDLVVPPFHIGAARNSINEPAGIQRSTAAKIRDEWHKGTRPNTDDKGGPQNDAETNTQIPNESAIVDEEEDFDDHKDYPLAVELKPFTNKVGGHTAIFKFSERAVCKALVNRENKWYETIEREHKELLQFMPRYIGVLNVRQHFHTKEDFLQQLDQTNTSVDRTKAAPNVYDQQKGHKVEGVYNDQAKNFTNKLASPTFMPSHMEGIREEVSPLPEVVLDDNMHIIPNSMYHQYSSSRSHSNSPSSAPIESFLSSHSFDDNEILKSDFKQGSGYTSINTKLQELVVKEAFKKRKSSISGPNCTRSVHSRMGSSSSLRDSRNSRSSSTSSHKNRQTNDDDAAPGSSMKRITSSATNMVDLHTRNSSLGEDDDVMFKLDDDVPDCRNKTPEEQEGVYNHESVSVEETSHTIVSKFILLEDLTRKLKCPSVLDLKMGTRQYGVDAKRTKQKSQREKCKNTTSRKLGVRLCGLKIWDNKQKYYIRRDKYFGRRVKVGWQFARVLARFLYDGLTTLSIIKQIPLLIQQLDTLYTEVGKLKSYRLYGSSLLLFYDGDNPNNKRSRVKVNIIDFARCVTDHDMKNSIESFKIAPHYPDKEDQGFLRGVKSLRFYLLHIWNYLTNDTGMISDSELAEYLAANGQKFGSCWDWLDEFDKEDESEANDCQSPLRVKWRKYELIFDIEPRFGDELVSD